MAALYNPGAPFEKSTRNGPSATTVRKDRMDREAQLIERVRRAIPSRKGGGLRLGIGDDAAVVAPRRGSEWVLSCDAFLEGVHFLSDRHPPDSVGFKALVRATSDLAAMGAQPRFFLLTLALPARETRKMARRVSAGNGARGAKTRNDLAGGDLTKNSKVSISITVVGEVGAGLAVKRLGARPGDILFVSGRLEAPNWAWN